MAIRKLMAVVPVVAALAVIAPVASANADTTPATSASTSTIPCYPYPAFCSVDGTQLAPIPSWWPLAPKNQSVPATPGWNPWQIHLPGFPSS